MTKISEILKLILVDVNAIGDQAVGLNEPSGLTLDAEEKSFFTVSDDTKAIFRINLKGKLLITDSFFIQANDLEGIACSPDGKHLMAVEEETNSVIRVDLQRRVLVCRCPLEQMENYNKIERHFPQYPDNKGLEGITINTSSNCIYTVKEGRPGLIIKICPDLKIILEARLLNKSNGFEHPRVSEAKLDFSGLSYDSKRDLIWIASDKGECIYLYDWESNQALQRIDLKRSMQEKDKLIRKIEGIAVDSNGRYFYAVSERDCKLYTYKIKSTNE